MTDIAPPNRTTSAHPRQRAVLAAVLAGVLVLATVIGSGWFLSAERRSARDAKNLTADAPPDDGWANGAVVDWRTSIGTNQEIVTAGNHLIAVNRPTTTNSHVTLTGYTIGDEGLSEAWTTTVSLPQEVYGNPEFLAWGESTLVHDTTLIDLDTGRTSAAPWNARAHPMLADDLIITCNSDDSCQAWRQGEAEPLWSAQAPGASRQFGLSRLLTTYVRRNNRYIIMDTQHIINLDTGQEFPLELPALADYRIAAASNGWIVAALNTQITINDYTAEVTHVYEFDIDGGAPTGSYVAKLGIMSRGILIYKNSPRLMSDYRTLWRDGDFSPVLALGHGDTCTTSIEVLGGPTFDVPSAGATSTDSPSGSAISPSSKLNCPHFIPSPGHRVLLTAMDNRTDANSFHFLHNLATGEAISFEGIDTTANSQLELVRSDLILGYDPDDGEVYGFSPAGSR